MQALIVSTASQILHVGPLMTTAGAAATGLTIANTNVKLYKRGATSAANKNSGGLTEIGGGMYYGTFDATDSNTVGNLRINIEGVAGMMPFGFDVPVRTALVHNAEVLGTEYRRAHMAPFTVSGTAYSGKNVAGSEQFSSTLTKTAGSDPVTGAT